MGNESSSSAARGRVVSVRAYRVKIESALGEGGCTPGPVDCTPDGTHPSSCGPHARRPTTMHATTRRGVCLAL
ncbi:hypothetical protein EON67_08145 [archaeon]|nr:MAG: hypothetical protein EON67_08145 [archaeon]